MAKRNRTDVGLVLEPPIFVIRGQRVILDADLARIYGVSTHQFNQAIKRNRQRFPNDFAFQLTADEVADFRVQVAAGTAQAQVAQEDVANSSQFVMSSSQAADAKEVTANSSHFATSSGRRRGAA